MDTAKRTVLHADDVSRWRLHVEDLLGDEYRVVSCEDCESVLEKVEEGGIDVLILDQLMPGSHPLDTGLDVCLHLKRKYPSLPIIIYTGAWRGVEEVDRADLERKAKASVVFKEIRDPELDDLKARVKELLSSG